MEDESQQLAAFIDAHPRLVVLTGAGVSAASGIPTYRDREGRWRFAEPILHQEFMRDPETRRRYWARSLMGWPTLRDARPNGAHRSLARLESTGRLELIVTQNVDRLHQRAGSRRVVDLHGRVDRVICLGCGARFQRSAIQQALLRHNAGLGQRLALLRPPPGQSRSAGVEQARPDGDAAVAESLVSAMRVTPCEKCGGVLKPDVVFFGGTVPRERVARCLAAVDGADALLAIGSSLKVYSGFRFCRHAAAAGKPVAVINPGQTRADELAGLRLRGECGPLLEAAMQRLDG